MNPSEIRQSYLDYFQSQEHEVVASSPVVPQNDPTLLFTNAGMNQFKDLLLGNEVRNYKRAASVQKCIRAGGKHNDLDEVGKDGRHLTFFEMLGNWSFGDYYKEKAIFWAWRYLLDVLKLDVDRLYVTIYKDDDEAFQIWTEKMGVAAERIVRLGDVEAGDEENFWSMGATGPCGPCTEIHYDLHPEAGPFIFTPNYDEDRINEIWNLVFMEFNRLEDGSLEPLPLKSVDTGMGLDRAAMVLANRDNVFHTDLFTPIFRTLFALRGSGEIEDLEHFYKSDSFTDHAVIADHIRTVTFAICDGAQFSNEGRGYVLRRILRRAVRHGRQIGFKEPFLHKIVATVVEHYGHAYPELNATGVQASELIKLEEERFFQNLDRGLALFDDAARRAENEGRAELSGSEVFELHATFGFPPDLTEIMAEERGMTVDHQGYELLWEEHRQMSRGKDSHVNVAGVGDWRTIHDGSADHFIGYSELSCTTVLQKVRHVEDAEYELLLEKTPFYAESGGQIGDRGQIKSLHGELSFIIHDTQKSPIGIVHRATLQEGSLKDELLAGGFEAVVDTRHRQKTACNHTATHLLHSALQKEISNQIFQAGSLVAPERLRFDFRHPRALEPSELAKLENRVNRLIRARQPVNIHPGVARDVAVEEMGAMAIFGEKYGDTVRVVQIPDESTELCGGIHVENTGDIGLFRITSEGSVGAGIRRIEAVTEEGAIESYEADRALLEELTTLLKTDRAHVRDRAQTLLEERNELEKSLERLSQKLASQGASDLLDGALDVEGVTLIAKKVALQSRDQLMAYSDKLRDHLQEKQAVVLLGTELDNKAALLCLVTDKAFKERGIKAGQLINAVATYVDGRGGGRPTLAQAGGTRPEGLDEAIFAFEAALRDAL